MKIIAHILNNLHRESLQLLIKIYKYSHKNIVLKFQRTIIKTEQRNKIK